MNIAITKLIRVALPLSALLLTACSAGGGAGSATPPVNGLASYTVGGSVTGLLTNGSVVLQNNGGNNTTVSANGSFSFATSIASGSTYAVTVLTQPTGQTCSITNGSGSSASANVTNIAINCSASNAGSNYNISATVTGLVANTSVVLQDNGGDNLTISSNITSNFNTALAGGAAYAVTILTQPTGENCTVTSGSGTVGSANVNVAVVCIPSAYTIGVSVTGLVSGHNVVLQNNGGNNLTVTTNGSFTFTTPIANGLTYSATILTQPTSQSCSVTNGNGTVAGANISNISINCSSNTYNVGGTITGLTGTVVLQNNGADNLTSTANGSFNFNTPITSGVNYAVAVLTQPSGQMCSVSNGSGTMGSANVTNVGIACSTTTGMWTWESGANTAKSAGVYGTLGTPAVANVPSSRIYSSTWTDTSGNLWLFGGGGYNSGTGLWDDINDLWKYSLNSGQWTWVSGSNTFKASGVYGTLGTAAVGNVPGARTGAISWIDASNNLWLFGGVGYDSAGTSGQLNDLWMYSPSSGLWTWMSGTNTGANTFAVTGGIYGVYGTQGTPAIGNVPGMRSNAISWTDSSGNLWLFGGAGFGNSTTYGYLNDLWKYSPSTNLWTWVSGMKTVNNPGVYGTKGTAAVGNVPGGRFYATSWIDASGNLWLFGGEGFDSTTGFSNLNDLWKFAPNTGQWTWISGSSTISAIGVYGTLGVAASTNMPGARQVAVSWTDASGNLWLFGGFGADSIGITGGLNDLWKYSPSANSWIWLSGSKTVGAGAAAVYGTLGIAASGNVPGGRIESVSWIDASGNLWLFGGSGAATGLAGFLNDLWKYAP
jgi:N-acetylneuraminic acid mutarotase